MLNLIPSEKKKEKKKKPCLGGAGSLYCVSNPGYVVYTIYAPMSSTSSAKVRIYHCRLVFV